MVNEQLGILIVEKNKSLAENLSKLYDWDSIDCFLAAFAADDEDAREKIRLFHPALVIMDTDVSSSDSGIAILKEVTERPDIYTSTPLFLCVTENNSFATAQKAIEAGARGIYSTSVKPDEIKESIEKAILAYREKIRLQRYMLLANEDKKIEILQRMFIFNQLKDNTYKAEMDIHDYQVAIIHPDLCGYRHRLGEFKELISSTFLPVHHYEMTMDPCFAIIFINEDDDIVQGYLSRFYSRISENTKGCFAAIGKKGHGLEGALESFREAKSVMQHVFYFTDRPFITVKDLISTRQGTLDVIEEISKDTAREFLNEINNLVQYIEIYDVNRIMGIMDERQKWLKTKGFGLGAIRNIGIAFVIQIQDSIHAKHPEKAFEPIDTLNFVTKVYEETYYDNIMATVSEFTTKLASAFANVANDSKILKIVQYVRDNFNQDLKLEGIAALFDCNSAYLGKKFHDFTGTSFNTFLDDLRIGRAKELLKDTHYKIYEISLMLGYSNTDYFYLKFKKATGMTPKEYQKTL